MKALLYTFIIFFMTPLQAEIEKVTITWTSILCRGECGSLLEKQFSRIKGVASVNVNQQAGSLELRWKPYEKFSFAPINVAMELVGLSIKDIRVSVRGTIRSDGRTFSIVSLGDNTPFILLNPITPSMHSYVTEFNTANRQLSPEMQQKLYNGLNAHKIATIDGPLFMPERSPPLMLIIAQVNFADQSQDQKSKQR